jgi:hypothetical protein
LANVWQKGNKKTANTYFIKVYGFSVYSRRDLKPLNFAN